MNLKIKQVVGDAPYDRKVKDKLVKTTAFINELFRYVSVGKYLLSKIAMGALKVIMNTRPSSYVLFIFESEFDQVC